MSRVAAAVFISVIAIPPAAWAAGEARNALERGQDRRERRQDRLETKDDLRDVEKLEAVAAAWDRARAAGDMRQIAELDAAFQDAVAQELTESRGEAGADRRDLRRSRREVRRGAASGSTADLRDDVRDLRDDRRDLRQDRRNDARVAAIATEVKSLGSSQEARALDRKRALLGELTTLAKSALREDREERREDRRELREDRREAGGH